MDINAIRYWNAVTLEADRVTHTERRREEAAVQGPLGSSRAFAIVHLAMHDAFFGIQGDHRTYLTPGTRPEPDPGASVAAAIAAAAHVTLSSLYPCQRESIDDAYFGMPLVGAGIREGHAYGRAIGELMLARRSADPSTGSDGYCSSRGRLAHRVDPSNSGQGFYAPFYGRDATCFAVKMRHGLKPPPAEADPLYVQARNEVRHKGIAPELVGTLPAGGGERTPEETLIGTFWAYDGAREIGTPPRLFNQIVCAVSEKQQAATAGMSADDRLKSDARLFALVNTAMADAGILAWEQKYKHDFWRPVVAIREQDPSLGPAAAPGRGDDPASDAFWLPLGAPDSNPGPKKPGRNFTPSFPAYPSGHATFGAAALGITRLFYGCPHGEVDTLAKGLEFISDELNGMSTDAQGVVRPRHLREFEDMGLWGMIEENARSRVYLGVHWLYDGFVEDENGQMDWEQKIGGVPLGLEVAKDIFATDLTEEGAATPGQAPPVQN